jgi:hypothetical protein
MEPIALTFEDSRFSYAQLERHGVIAVYTQTHKGSGTQRYEVVRIRVQKAHTWPNGQTTPDKEAYPGATTWGRDAFTFFDLASAREEMTDWSAARAASPRATDAATPPPSVWAPTQWQTDDGVTATDPFETHARPGGSWPRKFPAL